MEDLLDTTCPHISIEIDEADLNKGALEILKTIRPNWKPEDVEFKLLTDGITNKLVGCKGKDLDISETVLVRIYGNKTDLLIDRKAETRNIILLGKVGLAPTLFATFKNGLAYQFIPGCTLTTESVQQPEVYRLVAKRVAKLHKVQVDGQVKTEPVLWEKIYRFLSLVPDVFSDREKEKRFQKIGTPKWKLAEELDFLKTHLVALNSPVVFAHNDLLLGNVIYTKEKRHITFIDFEYAAFNYQAYDISNHFAEFVGLDNVDYKNFPDRNLQLDWLRNYLEEFQGDYSEKDLETLYVQVNQFCLITHLFWGIWSLIQTEHSYINFDFLGYAAIRFNEYFLTKETLMALQLPR